MIFTMNRDALLHAASVAADVAKAATTPEMGCVLMEAGDGSVLFRATDGDRSVSHSDIAMVDEQGSAMVSAVGLRNMVKSLPDGAVTVESSGGAASVAGGRSRFAVPSLDPGEYQGPPSGGDGPSCRIDAGALASMAKVIAPFCAKNDPRASLNGVHVSASGGELSMEATDSTKTARVAAPCEGGDFECVVPPEFLVSASGAMFGEVELRSDGNRMSMSCDSTETSTREIGAKFPNLAAVFPKSPSYEVRVSTADMRGAMSRACMVGSGKLPAHIVATGGFMSITCSEDGAGSFAEEIPCEGEMDVYAATHVMKASLDAMDGAEVVLSGESPLRPILIRGGSVEALAMPMRPSIGG